MEHPCTAAVDVGSYATTIAYLIRYELYFFVPQGPSQLAQSAENVGQSIDLLVCCQNHVVGAGPLRRSGTLSVLCKLCKVLQYGACKETGRPFLDYLDLQLGASS